MPRHVLVRFLAPLVGLSLGFVAYLMAPGTELMRMLVGLGVVAVVTWIGDVGWKRRASAEEIRRDLGEGTDDV